MKVIQKIALKGSLLVVVLVAMNFIYKATLWESDLEQYSGLADELSTAKNADILYLGDCSDAYFGKDKGNEKGISQLLDSLLPAKKVATISEVGFHAGMYASILQQVPEDAKLKTVVVTMNMRSFSALIMHTEINNSLNQRMVLLNDNYPPLLNRFFLIFKKASYYSENEIKKMREYVWKNEQIEMSPYPTLSDWATALEEEEVDKNSTALMKEQQIGHLYNYAFQINPTNNPRIHDFDKIVELAKERNWKLVFHLLPENTVKFKELIGEELAQLINYNRKLLNQRYHKDDVTVIDNLELLDDKEFIEDLPNSHFHYNGRRLMAKELSKLLLREDD